jgi:hypothetical protein
MGFIWLGSPGARCITEKDMIEIKNNVIVFWIILLTINGNIFYFV